jgi:dGTPase
VLEREGQGLNLTWEVRDGILNHSKARTSILAEGWDTVATLEAQICKIADSVAYINHDLEDALRAGVLRKEDLPKCVVEVLGHNHSQRINTLVCDIVSFSWAARGEDREARRLDGASARRGEEGGRPPVEIGMSPDVLAAADTLREFLFQRVYLDESPHSDTERARQLLRRLYGYFTAHPDNLPVDYLRRGDSLERAVVDYIASMTDRYALQVFAELNLPRLWPVAGASGIWSAV